MKRVAVVAINLSGVGGWARYARDLCLELQQQGVEVTAIVQQEVEAPVRQLPLLRGIHEHLLLPAVSRAVAERVEEVCQQEGIEVVHVTAEPYLLLLPFLSERRYFLTIHGTYADISGCFPEATFSIARLALEQIEAIVAVSRYTYERFLEKQRGAYQEKLHCIVNGIDCTRDVPAAEQKEGHRIVSIGSHLRRKGHSLLLRACRYFLDCVGEPFHLDVYGKVLEEGAFYEAQQAREYYGLEKHVTFHIEGVSDQEIDQALASASLFMLLPIEVESQVEGFGLVYLEAAHCGVPSIGSVIGGCSEAIAEGVSGYVCDPYNSSDVAWKMREVLIQKSIPSQGCKAWAQKHHIVGMVTRLCALYERSDAPNAVTEKTGSSSTKPTARMPAS